MKIWNSRISLSDHNLEFTIMKAFTLLTGLIGFALCSLFTSCATKQESEGSMDFNLVGGFPTVEVVGPGIRVLHNR